MFKVPKEIMDTMCITAIEKAGRIVTVELHVFFFFFIVSHFNTFYDAIQSTEDIQGYLKRLAFIYFYCMQSLEVVLKIYNASKVDAE